MSGQGRKRPRLAGRGLRPADPDCTGLESSIREFLEWMRVQGYSEKTAETRGVYLAYFATWLAERGVTDPREVTKPVLERYRRFLYHYRKKDGAPLSFRSQHGRLVPVRALFKWLARSNRLLYNPASELELPKLEQRLPRAVLSRAEAERVLSAVFDEGGPGSVTRGPLPAAGGPPGKIPSAWAADPDPVAETARDAGPAAGKNKERGKGSLPGRGPRDTGRALLTLDPLKLRDRAILEVLYSTGVRRSELINLKLYDVDAERGTLMVREGKGRKDRMVPIGERAAAWVAKYLSEGRPSLGVEPDDGTLFLTVEGTPFTPNRLTQMVRGYVNASGVGKKGACHLFRHTMATLMLEGGADIRFIQQMLGHAKLETTQIYTQVSIRKLKEIHAATHPGARLSRRETGVGRRGNQPGGPGRTGDGRLEPGESDQMGERSPETGETPSLPSTPDSRLLTPVRTDELLSLLAADPDDEVIR